MTRIIFFSHFTHLLAPNPKFSYAKIRLLGNEHPLPGAVVQFWQLFNILFNTYYPLGQFLGEFLLSFYLLLCLNPDVVNLLGNLSLRFITFLRNHLLQFCWSSFASIPHFLFSRILTLAKISWWLNFNPFISSLICGILTFVTSLILLYPLST